VGRGCVWFVGGGRGWKWGGVCVWGGGGEAWAHWLQALFVSALPRVCVLLCVGSSTLDCCRWHDFIIRVDLPATVFPSNAPAAGAALPAGRRRA
jgi:hypothetical protein